MNAGQLFKDLVFLGLKSAPGRLRLGRFSQENEDVL
jgi:hypothetical protein